MNLAQRNTALHTLYANRKFFEFMHGEQWMQNQIDTVWQQYITICLDSTGIEIERAIAQISWEEEHGYLEAA